MKKVIVLDYANGNVVLINLDDNIGGYIEIDERISDILEDNNINFNNCNYMILPLDEFGNFNVDTLYE